jgi:predicted exporter
MFPGKYPIKWPLILAIILLLVSLFFWGNRFLKVETDILQSMPQTDPVLADARLIIEHLPVQDRVIIHLEQASADRERLVRAALFVEERLRQSGYFTQVGISDHARFFPELMGLVMERLPVLFDDAALEEKIRPLLTPENISGVFTETRRSLEQLEGIGSAERIAKDPLGFSGIVLKPLSAMLPASGAQFYRGQLLSADGRHALVVAHIDGSGTDSTLAASISSLVNRIEAQLRSDQEFSSGGYVFFSTGAYRAAIDNETIAKRDTRLAIILTTLAIALLLLFTFPRPLIGLLALIPSTVGAMVALFVCSFLFSSISILAIGFGGAIMAFTVDLGLTYLLFLDQPIKTYGRSVARQLWTAELLSVLTTLGAFLLLLVSDFKILAQIGVFAALGATFALLFVHYIFPVIFPVMPPAKRPGNPRLQSMVRKLAAPARWKWMAALIFGLVMLIFAKPVFDVNLQAMNSVRPETLAAEEKIQSVWGDLSGKCYLYLEAPTMKELQQSGDRLQPLLDSDVQNGRLAGAFLPSALFPSEETGRQNFAAWRAFWTLERRLMVKSLISKAAVQNGFTVEAFDPFFRTLSSGYPGFMEIPVSYFDLFGITKTAAGYVQLSLLTTGKNYNAQSFFDRLTEAGSAKMFDADLFNTRLGEFLTHIFIEIALIVSIGIILVVFLFFLDWRLSLAVLAPITFALVATLGTLKLIGHPLDIPGIMLWIVIMGMGIDYAIYYVCMYQRYPDERHPAMDRIKLSVFLAAATTFIGFGVLALAEHSLLRSIGLTSLFGIAYSLLGTYFILPTLMQKIFAPFDFPGGPVEAGSPEHARRTVLRFRHLPGHPRIFARMKLKMDPMFSELHRYVQNPRRIIDIGCGFGVPAAWLLELYPQARVFGLEPDEERVFIANRVIGDRGRVKAGLAPDLPDVEGTVDHVMMLDMIHLISDEEVRLILRRIYDKLDSGGTLLIRATVPSGRKVPWKRWVESTRLRMAGMQERFRRSDEMIGLMSAAGFRVTVSDSPTAGVEEKWFQGSKA